MSKRSNWTLEDEKRYLDHLGELKWSKNVFTPRITLLRNYIKTTPNRTEEWVPEAVEYAKALLEKELEEIQKRKGG